MSEGVDDDGSACTMRVSVSSAKVMVLGRENSSQPRMRNATDSNMMLVLDLVWE